MQWLALSSVRSHDSSVIAVRKRQLHKGPVASVAEPGLIPRTKRCAMHDTRVADGPIDPPTEHIHETGDVARPSLTAKLESAIRRVSAIRCFFQTASNRTADAAPPLTLAQSLSLLQELEDVEKELWDMREAARGCSGSIDARFQMARRRSAKEVKLAGPRKKRVASEARKAAGKRKVGSLSNWHGEVRTAHQDLKGNGYAGTLKLKKGMPLYERIQENRRTRFCANVPGTLGATFHAATAAAGPADCNAGDPCEIDEGTMSADAVSPSLRHNATTSTDAASFSQDLEDASDLGNHCGAVA